MTASCERCGRKTWTGAAKKEGRYIKIEPADLNYLVFQAKMKRMPAPKIENWWVCGECAREVTEWLYAPEARDMR